ncbi:hypothetical protein DWUX_505 [Desulfovibrio diazotrophicus]|nr:hypothetical protein DWUX_505 [Desulfovibrio diazotrophicus]
MWGHGEDRSEAAGPEILIARNGPWRKSAVVRPRTGIQIRHANGLRRGEETIFLRFFLKKQAW